MNLPPNTDDLLNELHCAAEDPSRNGQGWYCCDCGELIARAAVEIELLRTLVAPAIAANIWLFEHGDESERATVACDLNRALCAINDSQPVEETE